MKYNERIAINYDTGIQIFGELISNLSYAKCLLEG